jgi:hypothetical protein
MADTLKSPAALGDVLDAEHVEINKVRDARKKNEKFDKGVSRPAASVPGDGPTIEPNWARVIKEAHDLNFVGLAFSGGGIRSASFNLGVLQALADLKLLFRFDYLSTVSGGGYIGAWLAAWTKRIGSFAKVQANISTHRVNLKDDKEQPPVRFLRVFSNYLTPNLGVFSGDTWAMIAIYIRNLLLNQTIILALLAALLLVPRAVKILSHEALSLTWIGYGLMPAIVVLLLLALWTIQKNMGYLDLWKGKVAPRATEQKWIFYSVCAPIFAAAVVSVLWLACPRPCWYNTAASWLSDYQLFTYQNAILIGIISYSALWGLASLGSMIFGKRIEETATSPRPHLPWEKTIKIGATLGAGALAGWLFALLSCQALWQYDATKQQTLCLLLSVGVPLLVGVFLLTYLLHIGLMGIVFRDWKREWWGRLGGWLLIFSITWLALFWVALCFPDFITNSKLVNSIWKEIAAKYLTSAWILSTIGTVMAGNSKNTGKPGTTSWLDVAIKFGPYVFMAGLLCWVSYGMDCLLATYSGWWPKVFFAAAVVVVLVIMAQRVDINQFSMHMFYRNRLVSCFLGASNEKRSPNRFTGFDPGDDMPLKDLRLEALDTDKKPAPYDGPYPVMNMALNLVKGKDLAWQERKAESFVMTPLYCGYDVWLEVQDSPMLKSDSPWRFDAEDQQLPSTPRADYKDLDEYGYRPTEEYAFPIPQYHGPNLGLAMAISGAAASPNMGYHSSVPVAFLMTVFNVRLGQWLGNPRNRETSKRATPFFGLGCLINELLGGTDDEAGYVYLSDGGHFENMGLYELVKRRCGLIILCDAEEDAGYTFSGLGNAIRKCRIDMGIDIELDTSEIVPDKTSGLSKQHYAVGTIHYEYADKDAPTGTIIYFKSSLTGNESADVKNYKKEHDSFPHESTANQWFSESQFESYRQLGYETVSTAIRNTPPVPLTPKEKTLREHFEDFGAKITI